MRKKRRRGGKNRQSRRCTEEERGIETAEQAVFTHVEGSCVCV